MKKNQNLETPVVPKVSSVFGPLILGKALFYNDVCQQLYFVDMHSYDIHRFDPRTNDHIIAKLGEKPLAFIIPIATIVNHFIVGAGAQIIEITWDGKSENIEGQKVLQTVDRSFGCGVNNAVVTPRGSLFIATFSETDSGETEVGKSAILKYTSKSNELTPVQTELSIPNGMTFSICGKTFYLADSHTTSVDKFCFNVETEEITNREVFFDFVEKQIDGKPFNVMTDGDGRIWVSSCGGDWMIRVCQHKSEELLRVKFEASIITSSCFAGSFLREMYVTSGRFKLTEEELEKYPKSGYFFRLTNLGSIKGLPCKAFCPDSK